MEKMPQFEKLIKAVTTLGMEKASLVFAKLLKNGAKIEIKNIKSMDISEITASANAADSKVVGAYVDLKGEMSFKFLFLVNETEIFTLTDLMLKKPLGTMREYNQYTYSATQEIGNILASTLAGVFASELQIKLEPTPAVYIHDYSGTIFEEYFMRLGATSDEIFIIESVFSLIDYNVKCNMFIVPLQGGETIAKDFGK